ncbi:MAG TPA: hypothetical protein VL523_14755, partial [Terriglobia bacterium]|nr:hypothetical protein [Terriglobia bacterium]
MLTELTVVYDGELFTFFALEIHHLLEDVTSEQFPARSSKPPGNGKPGENDAFRPSQIGHWIWLAQQGDSGSPIVFYRIGGRRIFHRKGDNYLGDGGLITVAPGQGQGLKVIPTVAMAQGGAWQRPKAGESPDNASGGAMAPTYTEVLEAMEDRGLGQDGLGSRIAATEVRSLLKGVELAGPQQGTHFMLCSLAAAMYIGEPRRNFSCLPTHLMILDILETGLHYSAAGLTATTWKEVLWSPDGVGPRNDAYGVEYPPGTANELGGLMPAGHKGSFDSQKRTSIRTVRTPGSTETKEQIEYATLPQIRARHNMTVVEQKEASLTIRWLARMVERTPACQLTTPAFASALLTKAQTLPELFGDVNYPARGDRRDAAKAKLKALLEARFVDLEC